MNPGSFWGCNSQFISPNNEVWPSDAVAKEYSALPGGSVMTTTGTLATQPSPFLTTTWSGAPWLSTLSSTVTTVTTLATSTPADIATKTPTTRLTGAAIDGIAASAAAAVILVVGIIILFLVFSKRKRHSTQPNVGI